MGKRPEGKSNTLNLNNLKFYYGIPHAHSGFSTGRGTPIEAFDYDGETSKNRTKVRV